MTTERIWDIARRLKLGTGFMINLDTLLEKVEEAERNKALTIPVVSRQFKEVNKIDVEDYDLSTVWVLDPNYDNKQNHILDHIDPNSVKIEFLKRRP